MRWGLKGWVKSDIEEIIKRDAPESPPCFHSRTAWVSWLSSAHQSGVRIFRRVDVGRERGNRVTSYAILPIKQIAYCADCPAHYMEKMQGLGRCEPCEVSLLELHDREAVL